MTGGTGFATLPALGTDPLRVVVVGAGPMGRTWLRTIMAERDVDLVGIADLDLDAATAAAVEIGRPDLPIGRDAVELARRTDAQAVINVTVPAAHHPVTAAALRAGLPVLGEKPVAATVAEGLSLAATSAVTGQLFMVSQSRRYNDHLFSARAEARRLGRIGIVTADFFLAPRFGGFRDAMASPLLLDMAIHQFDMARYLLGSEPESVLCEEFNPAWSWYAGDAAATAAFTFDDGARFVFTGSWCSPGAETSWNGSWRISAEHGTVLWDGDTAPVTDGAAAEPAHDMSDRTAPGQDIAGSLREFVDALRSGTEPMGRVHTNVLSLAMVESAIVSARDGRRVTLDEILGRSHEAALRTEADADVRAAMEAWPSPRVALGAGVLS